MAMMETADQTTSRTRTADDQATGPVGKISSEMELVVSGPDGICEIAVSGRALVEVGRSADCDVRLTDGSVSRQHARLRLIEPMTVEDLGSHNGTRVDGRKLAARERVPLRVGAILEIGATTIFVRSARRESSALARIAGAGGPIVVDPQMLRLYEILDDIAPSPLSVLVFGETGVGKEHYARAVHERSARASRPYLQINCAALHENLLEAELFGYERGAFTGATHAKPGIFEAAAGGTVFLDEVGELSAATQAKLLRVLQDGSVQRIGSTKPIRVDVRIVSATNRDLRDAVKQGEFRADLFYRLDGVSVTLPPLRDRVEDIVPLAAYFALQLAPRLGRMPSTFATSAIEALRAHAWPGNVRELKNVVERSVILTHSAVIEASDLRFADESSRSTMPRIAEGMLDAPTPTLAPTPASVFRPLDIRSHVANLERERVAEAMVQTGGNQSQAARLLGISRNTLSARLKKYALEQTK